MSMSELDKIIAKVQKDHGKYTVVTGGKLEPVERIPTGIFPLDFATGGGIPRGRLTEIYGPESSGKTSVALLLIAYVQNVLKQKAVFVDLEHALDLEWAARLGVNTDELVIMYPDSAEQTVDLVEAVIHAEDVGIVVLDSLAAMITTNEIDSDASKQIVGGSSALVGKLIRKSVHAMSEESKRGHKPTLVCLNQIRHKIGVMFGDPETTSGGNAPRFAMSMRLRLYAKDKVVEAISKELPTFRTISGIIKKWKVPVVARNFEYDFCLIPHGNIGIAQAPSWNTVASRLKEYGALVNSKTGWDCMGVKFKTLDEIKAKYEIEPELRMALQAEVFSLCRKKMLAPQVDPNKEAGFVDMETGEVFK